MLIENFIVKFLRKLILKNHEKRNTSIYLVISSSYLQYIKKVYHARKPAYEPFTDESSDVKSLFQNKLHRRSEIL